MTSHSTVSAIRTAVRVVCLSATVFTAAGFASASSNFSSIGQTGQASSNTVTSTDVSTLAKNLFNAGSSAVNVGGAFSTGFNTANNNTTNGGQVSGAVHFGGSVNNVVNPMPVSSGIIVPVADSDTTAGSINTTGQASSNDITNNISRTLQQNVVNTADVTTGVNASAVTGFNTANNNTTTGVQASGNVDGTLTLTSSANSGAAAMSGMSTMSPMLSSVSNVGQIGTTGQGSVNTITNNDVDAQTLNVTNVGTSNTNVNLSSDTGHNTANNNTTLGGQVSGGVNYSFGINNSVN